MQLACRRGGTYLYGGTHSTGADAVVAQEDVVREGDDLIFTAPVPAGLGFGVVPAISLLVAS